MNNNLKMLDLINLMAFGVGIYALYIAFVNLSMNDKQNADLKDILDYLEIHLQDQDEHLHKQDELLKNLTKGD